MKRTIALMLALAAHAVSWATAAGPAPVVTITANGQMLGDGSVRLVDAAGDVTFWEVAGGTLQLGDGSVTVNPFTLAYKSDPFLNLTVSVVNGSSADLAMVFTVGAPFSAGPWDGLTTQLSGTVVDERQGEAKLSGVSLVGVVDGVDRLTTTMPDCVNPGVGGCGSFAGASAIPATAASGLFGMRLAFTASGLDKANLAARVELTTAPIPEPGTYALMLVGLGALAVVARRRGQA